MYVNVEMCPTHYYYYVVIKKKGSTTTYYYYYYYTTHKTTHTSKSRRSSWVFSKGCWVLNCVTFMVYRGTSHGEVTI